MKDIRDNTGIYLTCSWVLVWGTVRILYLWKAPRTDSDDLGGFENHVTAKQNKRMPTSTESTYEYLNP